MLSEQYTAYPSQEKFLRFIRETHFLSRSRAKRRLSGRKGPGKGAWVQRARGRQGVEMVPGPGWLSTTSVDEDLPARALPGTMKKPIVKGCAEGREEVSAA